jgi:hypothetical protein
MVITENLSLPICPHNSTSQQGYFSHDSDPESWDFRATTRPSLGLQERDYPTDGDQKRIFEPTQWSRFMHHVQKLNEEDPQNKRYKISIS